MRRILSIDIFAGCGGMSLGLHKSGIKGLLAIEKNDLAFETLKFNLIDKNKHYKWASWLEKREHDINKILGDFSKELKSLKGKVDLVVGGPPCQGFSLAGRRDKKDKRNELVKSYLKFIKIVTPKFLLFENVRGFDIGFRKCNGGRETPYSEYVVKQLEKLGYVVRSEVVSFSKFGVPQRRKRIIIVGVKETFCKENNFFERLEKERTKFLKENNLSESVTVKDAISDLLKSNGVRDSKEFPRFKEGNYKKPKGNYQKLMRTKTKKFPDSHRFANHNENTTNKFKYFLKKVRKDTNVPDKTKKKFNLKKRTIIPLSEKSSSPTLTTLPDDCIHYEEPRILTVREYARIQSFPDDFEFKGKYTTGGKNRKNEVPRYTQVGNAIPPFFGEVVGQTIKKWNSEIIREKKKREVLK